MCATAESYPSHFPSRASPSTSVVSRCIYVSLFYKARSSFTRRPRRHQLRWSTGNRNTVLAHTAEMEFNRFLDDALGFLHRSTRGDAARKVRCMSAIVVPGFLDDDRISHVLTPLSQSSLPRLVCCDPACCIPKPDFRYLCLRMTVKVSVSRFRIARRRVKNRPEQYLPASVSFSKWKL